jgi:hypothetical protein
MQRITREPWFAPISKELPWRKRGHPITWQGKLAQAIFFILLISVLLYQLLTGDNWNNWNRIINLLFIWSWLFYRIFVSLTSDNPVFGVIDPEKKSVSGAKIRRKLDEMKNSKKMNK